MATKVSPDEAAGRRRETLADLFIVDADVHVHEDPAELAEYAEPPWDVALREIATVEERYLDLPGHLAAGRVPRPVPGRLEPAPDRHLARGRCARGWTNSHVDQAVLFPDHLLSLAMVRDPGVRDRARPRVQPLAARALADRGALAQGRARDRAAEPGGGRGGHPPARRRRASSPASTSPRPG